MQESRKVEVKKVPSKEKPDNFVWTDDEVQLLLKLTGEYKANKEIENI